MCDTICELHFHTKESSFCGEVGAADSVPIFKENGYDAIVVTDHYNRDYFYDYCTGTQSWEQAMEHWFLGWRTAKKAGDSCGVTVLHGAEFRFDGSNNDYLVYGMDEEMFLAEPALYELSPAQFSEFSHSHGLFFAQAHPFRSSQTRCDPSVLDGVEVFNSHPHHNAHNELAAQFAADNHLIAICGQDYHQYEAMLGCKTRFHGSLRSSEELVRKLFARDFDIILPEHPAVFTD